MKQVVGKSIGNVMSNLAFYSLLVFSCYLHVGTVHLCNDTLTLVVEVFSPTELRCQISDINSGTWIKDERKFLFYGLSDLHHDLQKGYLLDSVTYSLFFVRTMLSDEGTYECKENGMLVVCYVLIIEVPSRMKLTVDDKSIGVHLSSRFGSEHTFTCESTGGKPYVPLIWKANGVPIQTNFSTRSVKHSNGTFDVSSSFTYFASNGHENISCITSGHRIVKPVVVWVMVLLHAEPTFDLLINGLQVKSKFDAVPRQRVAVTCIPSFLQEPIRVIIEVEKFSTNSSQTAIIELKKSQYSSEVETIVYLSIDTSRILCQHILDSGKVETVAKVNINIFVPPAVFITNEWGNVTEDLYMGAGDLFYLECNAVGARPKVAISWEVSNEVSILEYGKLVILNNTLFELYDSKQRSLFRFRRGKGVIRCLSGGESEIQKIGRSLEIYEDVSSSRMFVVKLAVPTTLITVVIAFICYKRKKVFRAISKRDPPYARSIMRSADSLAVDKIQTKEYKSEPSGTYRPYETKELTNAKLNQQKSKEVYYSKPTESSVDFKIFAKEDLHLVVQIKKEGAVIRWMGTLIHSTDDKESVLATTCNDTLHGENHLNWHTYVKNVVDLQNHDNVVTATGICIDLGELFLLQEYIATGTLERHLKKQLRMQNDGSRTATQVAASVIHYFHQIWSGLEFIVAHGFAHPGLCLRKVLVTDLGICKLYDFCLKEGVQKKILAFKQKNNFLQLHLPPESCARNEYAFSSEIWSAAVLVWETLHEVEKSGKPDKDIRSDLYLPQPRSCPDYIYNFLKECWAVDPSKRPSLKVLRTSFRTFENDFQKFLSAIIQIVNSADEADNETQVYVSMERPNEEI